MRGSRILLAIGLATFLTGTIRADEAGLVGDASFASGNAGHLGASATINVGGPTNFQGLVQFDLSTLPAGITASQDSNASLRLFLTRIGSPGPVNIYAADSAWSEATVNGFSGFPGPGTLLTPLPVAASVAGSYIVVDVTTQVQAWLNGAPNYGFLIVANPSAALVYFDTKESPTTSHPASLEVNLVGAPGAVGPPELQSTAGGCS